MLQYPKQLGLKASPLVAYLVDTLKPVPSLKTDIIKVRVDWEVQISPTK